MIHRTLCIMLHLLLPVFLFSTPSCVQAESMRYGAAKADITPLYNGFPIYWLAGYALLRGNSIAMGISRPLYVRVLALQDSKGIKVIVAADILGFTRDMHLHIVRDAAIKYGIKGTDLLLAASHTHAGPILKDNLDPYASHMLNIAQLASVDKYTTWLEDKIVQLIGQAVGQLNTSPAVTLSYGVGLADFNVNRLGLPDKPENVNVLAVKSNEGKVHAIAFTYSCHPLDDIDQNYYNSGFPGVAMDNLEVAYPGSIALFIQGTAGDINPEDWWDSETQGSYLSCVVMDVFNSLLQPVAGPISVVYQEIDLPLDLNQVDEWGAVITRERLKAIYQSIFDNNAGLDHPYGRHAQQMINLIAADDLPTHVPLPVSLWYFNDELPLALLAMGGEVVSGYNSYFHTKNENGSYGMQPLRLWVAAFVHEVPSYIPTNEILYQQLSGGYEAGWKAHNPPVCDPHTGANVNAAISTGTNMQYYGWPCRYKGNLDGTPGVEELMIQTVEALLRDCVDTTPPTVIIMAPESYWAVEDSVNFEAQATDAGDIPAVFFSVREPDGGKGSPIGYEDIKAFFNASTGYWECSFDTTLLQDGYYILLAEAIDEYGNDGWSDVVPFSIRNWAVKTMLPSTPDSKVGRTMPLKFSLRIAADVDPATPFVCNEDLEISIYDAGNPGVILQSTVFGDSSKDYRIDGEMYITNFKTRKKPATYVVEIWRQSKNFMAGSFTFETVK